jgi:hypothetical protein
MDTVTDNSKVHDVAATLCVGLLTNRADIEGFNSAGVIKAFIKIGA